MHTVHTHLHFLKNKEIDELYVSVAIKSFALSMINIFIPLFFLKLGYSLVSVLIFYIILNATHALFVIPATKISCRYGFKHAIFYSTIMLIIFYWALHNLGQSNWLMYTLGVVFGIGNALFWIGHHVDFSKFSDKKDRGKEIGVVRIISLIFRVLGPMIGGLILTFIGFEVLLTIVALLLGGSTVPLFLSKDFHESTTFTAKEILKNQKVRDALAFTGYGIESGISNVIWPVFIFYMILHNNFLTLGSIASVSFFFSLLFVFVVAKISDIRRRLTLRLGAFMSALIWSIKFFVKTSVQVFVIDSFYGMSQTLVGIPFDALSYDKAGKSGIVEFIVFREIVIQIGRSFLFLIMMIITALNTSFFLASGASLLYFLF